MKILNKIISNMNTGKKNQSKTIKVSNKLDSKNKDNNRQKLFEHWCKKKNGYSLMKVFLFYMQ